MLYLRGSRLGSPEDTSLKLLAITVAVLLLYATSFLSRTVGSQWLSRGQMSAAEPVQGVPRPSSVSSRSEPAEQQDPSVTSSIAAEPTKDPGAGPHPKQCCFRTANKRSPHSTPQPAKGALTSLPETPNPPKEPEPLGQPVQFSLAERGN
jgi:hypothetical protein